MDTLHTFLWAAFGFILGEAVELYLVVRRTGALPKRSRTVVFWGAVLVMAGFAGFFSIAIETPTKIGAIFNGMAFPLIVHRFLKEQRAAAS